MTATNETHIPPFEGRERDHSAVQSEPRSGLSETPSAVRAHEVALTETWANLDESVKALRSYEKELVSSWKTYEQTYREKRADVYVRLKKDLAEQRKVERLLAAHRRIREPRRKS
jgi:hypothetical protein